jgi:hypothetical protein
MTFGTIGQALYMRLFFHLANLYDGSSRQRLMFQKRYDDICIEWLGGLTILAHKSKITNEQLGQHLAQLIESGFLVSYVIEPAKTAGRSGFTITFRPGETFFTDYNRFYRRQQQERNHWDRNGDGGDESEPLKVAYLFAEKRTGHKADSIAFVPSKDVETARQLLAELSVNQVPDFLDYALAEARHTDFDVQTLGGIKQYFAGYLAHCKHRADEQLRQAGLQEVELYGARQRAYDNFRRSQAASIFSKLPSIQQDAIVERARIYASSFRGTTLQAAMLESGKVRFTIEAHGEQLMTFEQWIAAGTPKRA